MIWVFMHGIKRKEFGPYDTEDEAKEAFQRRYGYWPEDAIEVFPWPRDLI